MRNRRLGVGPLCGLVVAAGCVGSALAQPRPPASTGPDVIVGELPDLSSYGVEGAYAAFAVGTTSCNRGNAVLNWWTGGTDNRHPAIGQNLFRLHNGRFEQIGQAWLKHGFTALQGGACTADLNFPYASCSANPGGGTGLGLGCSDPYSSGLNGGQGGLGPKWQVNAATGIFPYPFSSPSFSGAVARRLRVLTADINPTNFPAARYFVEGQYIAGDDAGSNNKNNNASYREVTFSGTNIALGAGSSTVREKPAIYAWQVVDPSVQISTLDVPGDGRFILASKVTGPVGGLYTYEYALHNLNSDRCAGSFSVPIPSGSSAAIASVGFKDVEYHSGEPNAAGTPAHDDWTSAVNATNVTWSGPGFSGTVASYQIDPGVPFKVLAGSWAAGTGNNHTANVLRWGTMFNFRFTSDQAPAAGMVQLGLWRPAPAGGQTTATMITRTPGGATTGMVSTGPCCISGACTLTTQAGCSGNFGTVGALCTPDPCNPPAVGACCDPGSGACALTTSITCAGSYQGDASSCSPSPCPQPTGACCGAGGACTIVQTGQCSGTYLGNATVCSPSVCASNDVCSSATTLCEGSVANGTNVNAGTDFNAGVCVPSSLDVWYAYTPTVTAAVTLTVGLPASGTRIGDSVLSVHSACNGTVLACDDDSAGNLLSTLTYTMTAGTRYLIRVASYGGNPTPGAFTLRVQGGQGCNNPQGACCNGTACTVVAQSSCTGSYRGNGSACGPTGNPTTCCPANFNQLGGVTVQDVFDFLAAWFVDDPRADFNGMIGVTVQDVFDFLSAWFAGC